MSIAHSDVDSATISRIVKGQGAKIFFIGILGSGMLPLGRLCLARGCHVHGSDARLAPAKDTLTPSGMEESERGDPCRILTCDLVVYTLAISEDDEQLRAAMELGIPCVSRAQLLGALMLDYPERIGIMGTHGKSTSVAMLHRVLADIGAGHTVVSGAELESGDALFNDGTQLRIVYEACEYRDSFLQFSPTCSLLTSIELDHTDYFPDIDSLCTSFASALSPSRLAVVNGDDNNCRRAADGVGRVRFFGTSERNDYVMRDLMTTAEGSSFDLHFHGKLLCHVRLGVIGRANAMDACGVLALCCELGIDPCAAALSLAAFRGIGRRLQLLGTANGKRLYYDYAHHPTEIENTVAALRLCEASICAVFRPHTFSRTEALYDGFCAALSGFDSSLILPIYGAREERCGRRGSRELARDVRGGEYLECTDPAECVRHIMSSRCPAIVLLGAGDMDEIKRELSSLMGDETDSVE